MMKFVTILDDTGQKEENNLYANFNNDYQLQDIHDSSIENSPSKFQRIPPRLFFPKNVTLSIFVSLILILNLCVPIASARANIMWDDQAYTSASHSTFRHTAQCFSCMSKFYEAVWPALAHVYKRPRNFTDRCSDAAFDSQSIPTVHCSTICIEMWEEPIVAGVKIRGHIRGCLDDILHSGFNQTIVAWYRWLHRDSCNKYRKRDLFMLPHDQSDDSLIHVCTCYADHCNTATGSRFSTTKTAMSLTLTAIISLLGRVFLYH